jgi:predicted MFS family arabinose efflux permease
MATFSLSFSLGNGVGALLIGSAVEIAGYVSMFLIGAALCATGLITTFANWRSLR